MDKSHIGKLRSLARLLNEDEEELVRRARIVQPRLTSLDDISENAYFFLCGALSVKQMRKDAEE